jgi:hypothetical protein
MTIVKTSPGEAPRSETSLKGAEAFDLYLARLSRNVITITEQSVLLMQALAEHLTLLRDIETGKAATAKAATALARRDSSASQR